MRPSVLVTKKWDPKTKKMLSVNWPLKFKYMWVHSAARNRSLDVQYPLASNNVHFD